MVIPILGSLFSADLHARSLTFRQATEVPPFPTPHGRFRDSAEADFNYVGHSPGFRVGATGDLKYFEVRGDYARVSVDWDADLTPPVLPFNDRLRGEIARYYISPDGYFGRIAGYYAHYFPYIQRSIGLNIHSGIEQNGRPLNVDFYFAYEVQIPEDKRWIFSHVFASYALASALNPRLGAALRFAKVAQTEHAGNDYESMLFGLGPRVTIDTPVGRGALDVMARLALDSQSTVSGPLWFAELLPIEAQLRWALNF